MQNQGVAMQSGLGQHNRMSMVGQGQMHMGQAQMLGGM